MRRISLRYCAGYSITNANAYRPVSALKNGTGYLPSYLTGLLITFLEPVDSFGPDFIQTNINRIYFGGFTASLNDLFGKLKESMKKNKRGISNDDVQGTSSSK